MGRFRFQAGEQWSGFYGVAMILVFVAQQTAAPLAHAQPPQHGGQPPHHVDNQYGGQPDGNYSGTYGGGFGGNGHSMGSSRGEHQGGYPGGQNGGFGGGPSMGGGQGGPRTHSITQSSGELTLRSATEPANPGSDTLIVEHNDLRYIITNGLPNHATGPFPNSGNPNAITAQNVVYRMPLKPEIASNTTPSRLNFGVALNGIPFDPGAGEFWEGGHGWQYEPLSGAVPLGIDANHAHVQPTGTYHYHGLPTGLLDELGVVSGEHSPIIGWAADGFPIYARYGYSDPDDPNSAIVDLQSSYLIRPGERPSAPQSAGGNGGPGGTYDGTFVADYEYVQGLGDLDECNGRFGITPDYPAGTYAYFLTEAWPVIPRYWRGTPHPSFSQGHDQAGPGGSDNRPGQGGSGGFDPPFDPAMGGVFSPHRQGGAPEGMQGSPHGAEHHPPPHHGGYGGHSGPPPIGHQ